MQYFILLREEVVRTEAFTSITDFAATASPNNLAELSFEPIPGGYYSLGNVFPAGLNEGQLFQLIETAAFTGEPSHGSMPLDINTHGINMSLSIVPEPSASLLAVFSFASLVCAARRRKERHRGDHEHLDTMVN